MYISVTEAQGQLLDLIRRARAGEEFLLTVEGETVARLGPPVIAAKPWKDMSPGERQKVIDDIVAKAPPKPPGFPDAAHSQDFLYDEHGLPA